MRCQEFLPTGKFKINHDFLKHYENRRNVVEEKPVSITFQELSSSYDFHNSENLVDKFLLNVKNSLKVTLK